MNRCLTFGWAVYFFAIVIFCMLLSGRCFASSAKSANYCMDGWACVEKVERNKEVSYWLFNKKPFVVTVTLDVKSSNLKSSNARQNQYTVNQVLQGHQRVKVLELQPINQARDTWYDESFFWSPGNMLAVHHADVVYHFPYAKGEHFRIVQGFGGGYSHQGASKYAVDFAMPIGTPIHAARAGTVIDLVEHNSLGGANREYAQYANYVVVLHDDDTTGEYYHLKHNGVTVALGDQVKAGQKIAYSGNTGFSSLPHLHFAVYRAKSFGKYQSLPFEFARQP